MNMIRNRLADLSCDGESFNKYKGMYEAALRDSGFESEPMLPNREEETRPAGKTRKRNRKVM